jgi:hypothetical protein
MGISPPRSSAFIFLTQKRPRSMAKVGDQSSDLKASRPTFFYYIFGIKYILCA